LTDEFSKKINALKSLIQNAVTPRASKNEGESMADNFSASECSAGFEERISAENIEDTGFGHVQNVNSSQASSIKFPKSSWELNQNKVIEAEPEPESTGILSL
jgi:hypothetical protein